MHKKIAFVISFISFGLIYFCLHSITDVLGIPTYIDFGSTITVTRGSGRYSYDENISGESTDVGIFIMIVSIMLAWRIYHWVISGNIKGNISKESHCTWLFWIIGMTVYIILTTPIWKIDMPLFLQRIIVLACGAGIAWFFYNKHADVIWKIRNSNNDNT